MENLIRRAKIALMLGIRPFEVADVLVCSGENKEDVFLAIQAAQILIKDEE